MSMWVLFCKPQMENVVSNHLPVMTFGCNVEEKELRVWCNCVLRSSSFTG